MRKQSKSSKKIKLGLPQRPLQEQTLKLFRAADYEIEVNEAYYKAFIDDPQIEVSLAQDRDLVLYTASDVLDAGITQSAFLWGRKSKLVPINSFEYGVGTWRYARVVLAVPMNSRVKSVKDLKGKKVLSRIPEVAKAYLRKSKVKAKVELTGWPSEPNIPTFGDAIIEFTNTGNALRAHNLRIVDTLMESQVVLFMNKRAFQDKKKREKVEDLGMLLKGARLAQDMAGLMLHAANKMLEEVFKILPALKNPTVTRLRGENWFDVLTVADKKEIRSLIPKLKEIGCTDIVEFPLTKVVP